MIQAQSADGVIHQFPEGTDPAVVDRAMKAYAQQSSGQSPAPAVQPRSLMQNVTGAMAQFNRGLGIGDELAAAGNTATNVLMGKTPLSGVVGDYTNSLAKQRAYENSFAQDHPHVAALARGTGMAATAAIPGGDTANAFAQAPRVVNMARGATTAGLTAAGYAAADAGTPAERLKAASDAATNPLVLGLGAVGGALAPAASRPTAPKSKISQDVIDLRARGVQLTPGQAKGGIAKAAEDAMTSTPILGTAIQDARHAGMESFNHAVANEALAPVGEQVPANIPAGHQTVAYVEKKLGELYDQTIPQGGVVADTPMKEALATRLGEIAQDMTPEGRQRLGQILDNRVTSRFDAGGDVIDGKTFQRVHSELGASKARFSASQDADQRAIGDALGVVQEEMRNAAARQNPDFAEQKDAIDQGYALFKRMQGAAASPGAEGGVFTGAQYGGAVRRGDRSLDKGASARGAALGQGLADSARAVLPSKLPDSGTATRGAYVMGASAPASIISSTVAGGPGAGLATAAGYGATLGGLKLASKAYSPEAIAAANRALDGRISRQQQAQAMNQLRTLAANDPAVSGLYREVAARLSRTLGVIGSQNALARPASPAR